MNLMKKEERNESVESRSGNTYRSPACDIIEKDDSYEVYFDVPGVEKDDIDIKVDKNVLSLTAECAKAPGGDYECLRDEMIYSGYRRSFDLGEGIDSEGIAAEYTNGTLRVTLPKRQERKSRQISISVG